MKAKTMNKVGNVVVGNDALRRIHAAAMDRWPEVKHVEVRASIDYRASVHRDGMDWWGGNLPTYRAFGMIRSVNADSKKKNSVAFEFSARTVADLLSIVESMDCEVCHRPAFGFLEETYRSNPGSELKDAECAERLHGFCKKHYESIYEKVHKRKPHVDLNSKMIWENCGHPEWAKPR